jgi:hypothetical protein
MRRPVLTSCLFVLLFLLGSCSRDEAVNSAAELQLRYVERIAVLQSNILQDCQEKVLLAASQRADSLLLDRARRIRRVDGRPPRPPRPGEPGIKELSAPLPLRPLFPFEIRFDTLLRDSLYQDSLRLDSIDNNLLLEEGGF